jgi:hypothetical protein
LLLEFQELDLHLILQLQLRLLQLLHLGFDFDSDYFDSLLITIDEVSPFFKRVGNVDENHWLFRV